MVQATLFDHADVDCGNVLGRSTAFQGCRTVLKACPTTLQHRRGLSMTAELDSSQPERNIECESVGQFKIWKTRCTRRVGETFDIRRWRFCPDWTNPSSPTYFLSRIVFIDEQWTQVRQYTRQMRYALELSRAPQSLLDPVLKVDLVMVLGLGSHSLPSVWQAFHHRS